MSVWYILGIALGLAMDAFAVSLASCCRLRRVNVGHISRLALSFGFFQFMMPVVGWLAGRGLSRWLGAIDHWVAFGLLALIGGKMLWDSLRPPGGAAPDPTRGWVLLTLGIATSIDALAVGLSLAFLNVSIWVPSIVIGIVAAVLTAIGAVFGSRMGQRFGVWAERFGGLVLIGIGVRILLSHVS
ncbi:MAG: manganese efflux pump MntP family protein [Actinobacteria bacterium]|nr:manganese efflux pump MntP family protein [Actinomycetota bacterium]